MRKKLKLDKNFEPMTVEDNDELFPNGIFEFNITKLIDHLKSHSDKFQIEQIDITKRKIFLPENLYLKTVQNADLTVPIILAEISPGRYNVIDGHHRVEKAHRLNIASLPGYLVAPDVHTRFITAFDSYKSFISYWNEKIRSTNA